MFNSFLARRSLAEMLFTISYISPETDIEKRSDELMKMFEWGDPLVPKHSGTNCRFNIEYGKGLKQNRPCYGLKIKEHNLLLSELWHEIIDAGIQNPSFSTVEISDKIWDEIRQMILRVLETLERFEDKDADRLQHLIENPFAYKLFAGSGVNTFIETFPVITSSILDHFQLSSLVRFGISKLPYITGGPQSHYYAILYGLCLTINDGEWWFDGATPLSQMVWIENLPAQIIEKYPFLMEQRDSLNIWKAVEFATSRAVGCFERFLRYERIKNYPIYNIQRFDVILVGVHDEVQVKMDLGALFPNLKPDKVSEFLTSRPSVISADVDYETALDHAFVKLNPQAATCIIRVSETKE